MKKIIILICVLFLTGCNATYEITIKDNKIKEKLTLIELDQSLFDVEDDTGWTLRDVFESQITNKKDEFSVEKYTVKDLSDNDKLGLEYNSKDTKSLINSSAINQCYENPKINIDEDLIEFSTGSTFKCYEYYNNLETITIVLKTNHEVVSSNAQTVEDNEYTWVLDKDSEKNIEFSYKIKEVKEFNFITILAVVIAILAIGFTSLYIYRKSKDENKI